MNLSHRELNYTNILYHCVKIGQSGLVNSKLNIKITQELNNI